MDLAPSPLPIASQLGKWLDEAPSLEAHAGLALRERRCDAARADWSVRAMALRDARNVPRHRERQHPERRRLHSHLIQGLWAMWPWCAPPLCATPTLGVRYHAATLTAIRRALGKRIGKVGESIPRHSSVTRWGGP